MNIRAAATAALALSAALILTGCGTGTTTEHGAMPGMDHGSSSRPADVNEADVMFASMMIVHHEQAIEMSDIILAKKDIDPRVIERAEAITSAQGPEITQLQDWLDGWGAAAHTSASNGMDHGDGIMSEDDLAALEAASGVEASRLFLTQMITHHEGAVEMAQTEVDDGSHPGAVELAQTIVDAQLAEIQEMKDLLAAL